ncbi:ABC transporter ATP-binding protein [Pararhizobium sp. IMCC21322]|uniref:ABC transporter ATP-binding protein n=1 Tax=Pararhizobium sp. IMCC21322 TaxID=3067903 RepID=UPI00274178DB|nr:sn-glycerol-3-phosphate ABC transporter ATP-binding protein UgpC [Pararhizobium sp. IMCC21322]
MADVTLTEITKSFGKVDVIHGVSITIADGEFVALVGPSGCGKSTMLRMIAGLEDPTTGEIAIGGQIVNDRLPKDRNIAMVFQSYALYPHMTVRENMSFALELEKRPKEEIAKAVAEASAILGLDDYLNRRPKALSGGQRQRVAMGRAIVRNPEVFLFDEPLSNLDAKLRTSMRKEVKLLHQRLKTTSIYVTHDQTEAMTMADRIVVMNHGKIEQIGTPLELYNKPDNLFVAGFIGAPQMNLLEGEVIIEGGNRHLRFPAGEIRLPDAVPAGAGQTIVLGIRPEHLRTEAESALSVVLQVSEPMGNETHLTCAFGDEEIRLIEDAEYDAKPGSTIHLGFDPVKVHVFDAVTGLRRT